jgi:hypothetical protein
LKSERAMSGKTKQEKEYKRLSIEELRNCNGCENYTDEEAEEVIESLEQFSHIMYNLYLEIKKNTSHENQ